MFSENSHCVVFGRDSPIGIRVIFVLFAFVYDSYLWFIQCSGNIPSFTFVRRPVQASMRRSEDYLVCLF